VDRSKGQVKVIDMDERFKGRFMDTFVWEEKKAENRKIRVVLAITVIGLVLIKILFISRDTIPQWGLRLGVVGLYLGVWYLFLERMYRWYVRVNYDKRANPIARFFLRFYRNKLATLGFFIVLTLVVVAVFAPEIAKYPGEYRAEWKEYALMPPSREHPLGTVPSGEDLFSLICYGTRISVTLGISVVSLGAAIGIALGVTAGYYGGKVDKLINYVTDVVMSFPFLVLILVIVGALRSNPQINERLIEVGKTVGVDAHLLMVFLALSFLGWTGTFRIVRGQVLSIREKDYVAAAKAIGATSRRIIFRHIAINTLAPVIVVMTLGIGGVILTEAALSYLGFGASVTTPSWGRLLSEANAYVSQLKYIHLVLFPGLAIFLAILGFTTMGDGVRDAIDPRLKL